MKASRRIFIKQGALATIATFGAGPLFWSSMDWAMAQDAAKALPLSAEEAAAKAANAINEVPYISTYYYQPTVDAGKPVTINYYVTNYANDDYMHDDHSQTFTIDYWVNGKETTVKGIHAGDNSLQLAPIAKGPVLFAFQATDQQGRTSHRLFFKFTVIDPASQTIPEDKILKPDLKKFGIYDDDTHPVETTAGLTAMLKSASDNGYRKVLLPKGIYRLDENSTVEMATQLTLDMNGSTFKLNPNGLESGMMLEMFHCTDSHVINGTFQGDLKEHVFTKRGADYWVSAIAMGQDAINCSFEDLKLVDITGAAVTTSIGGNHTSSYSEVTKGVGAFTLGDVDAQGKPIDSKIRATSEFVDISKFVASKDGFLQMGHYLGYQGNGTGTWVYKASFYDKDKNYISAIPGFLYRRLYPPTNANYARFTLYSAAPSYCGVKPEAQLSLFGFRPPYNCTFKNLDIESARACGMAPSGFNSLLVEGCTFTNSGSAASTCALDAEDGWDGSQDLYFRNNVFNKNPRNEFLTDAGHNFVMTGNTMAVVIRARTESYVFRNNTIKGGVFEYGARDHTNFPRVYNNTFVGPITLEMHASAPGRDYLIRNNIIENGLKVNAKPITWDSLYCYKDTFTGGETNAKLVDCVVKGTATAVKPQYNLAQSLALNKPVTATGFEGDSIPANAVDGFTDKKQGWWGAVAPASLTVDLGEIYPIDRIKIYTYPDGTRYYQYTVEVSTDNKNWTQVIDMSANIKPSTATGDTHTLGPVQGRYVRVNMIKNSANTSVHILELQVFADKQTGK